MKLTFINFSYPTIIIQYTFYYIFGMLTYLIFNYLFLATSIKNKIFKTLEIFNLKKAFIALIKLQNFKMLIQTFKQNTDKTTKDKSIEKLKEDLQKIIDKNVEESKDKLGLKENLPFFLKTIYFYIVCLIIILIINLAVFNGMNYEYKKVINKIFGSNEYLISIASNVIIGILLFGIVFFITDILVLPYMLFKYIEYIKKYIEMNYDATLIDNIIDTEYQNILLALSVAGIGTSIAGKTIKEKIESIPDTDLQNQLTSFKDKMTILLDQLKKIKPESESEDEKQLKKKLK